jgi:hypothetical protein
MPGWHLELQPEPTGDVFASWWSRLMAISQGSPKPYTRRNYVIKNAAQRVVYVLAIGGVITLSSVASSAPFSVGAAPKGEATAVASRIIKENFPSCSRVSKAKRMQDGSIRASCSNTNYLVFTVFNPKEGRALELAMNCTAAKKHLNIDC